MFHDSFVSLFRLSVVFLWLSLCFSPLLGQAAAILAGVAACPAPPARASGLRAWVPLGLATILARVAAPGPGGAFRLAPGRSLALWPVSSDTGLRSRLHYADVSFDLPELMSPFEGLVFDQLDSKLSK